MLRALLLFALWLLLGSLAFRVPPASACAILIAATLGFLQLHGRRGWGLRGTVEPAFHSLRRFRDHLPRLASMLLPLFLLDMGFSLLYGRLFPAAPAAAGVLEHYLTLPGGSIPVALMVMVLGPVIEEFCFRGWIQMELVRRGPPAFAVIASALLFAVAHGAPERIGYFFVYGVLYGYAVLLTRNIYSGVFLHLGMNGGVYALQRAAALESPGMRAAVLVGPAALSLAVAAAWLWRLRGIRATRRSRSGVDPRGVPHPPGWPVRR